MKGSALIEFALVFPFFFLMVLGSWDLVGLALARLSLQKACWAAAKEISAGGNLPEAPSSQIQLTVESLPSSPSRYPFRSERKIELVHVRWTKQVPLRFPLLRFVFQKKTIPLKVMSTAVRVSHE